MQMMAPGVTNLTVMTEFVLLGFPTHGTMGFLHPLLFFLVYLCALLGNGLIVLITTLDQHLHTPMYFFLRNLSFTDLCLISVTVPKSIANSLRHSSSISFPGCVVQVFMMVMSAGTEMHLLTVMSLDRYAAICHPLHYDVIMSRDRCVQLTAVSWLGGGIISVMNTAGTFSLSHCGSNVVHQFFCDIPQLLAIFCSENVMNKLVPILISAVLSICYFIFIIISYVHIFSAVRKIPSTEGKAKVYSTCLPHLLVVVLFLSTGCFAYLKPTSGTPSTSDLVISMFYTVVPPTFNPVIYSLRNQALKTAVGRLIKGQYYKK
ncbi:olfactory receptor 14A16-like [Talpa occidentalis]|uniref:olfactory receptor 14A16-like n=1 Tax=Talpa occidentalis TaxID=50954 RepID=UPI0023F62268|nr:olfactory receptor 14A16-like [Talpa occidentalis]